MSTNRTLRLIADELPPYPKTDNTNGHIQFAKFERVSGSELIKEGIKEIKGVEVKTEHNFKRTITDATSVILCNHFDNLQKMFRADGISMVIRYIIEVLSYNKMLSDEKTLEAVSLAHPNIFIHVFKLKHNVTQKRLSV